MKDMQKRGQGTLFIILGIILVIVVGLYFVGVQIEIIPPLLSASDAAGEMSEIDEHITDCLLEIGTDYVNQIGLQGGYLSVAPDTYRLYNDTTVSYLCWNQEESSLCSNRLLTVAHMEEELEDAIDSALQTCINVYDYSDDVEAAEDWVVEVEIQLESVDIALDYPVVVDKGEDDIASEDTFEEEVDAPLGDLHGVAQDIINDHALYGDHDQLLYMLGKLSRYTIYKYKPYPDVLYQAKLREHGYIFQFAIEGESKV
jgi:hypothetical protein